MILIVTDDQGYGDLGVTGNPILKTPHIDRLAAEGVWLKRFYVTPVCTLTRASLMTGRYNFRTRAIDTFTGRAMMEPSEVTVAEVLRDAGYATGIFGKWHLGDCYPMRAMDQGFTESLVHKGGGLQQPANPPDGNSYFDPILWHNGEPERTKGYCTDIYFDAALSYIDEQHKAGKPFFAYIATNTPHDPWGEVPQEHYERYKPLARDDTEARIYAMVANIDDNVGRVLAKLDELKIGDNTLVIYLHDNGAARPAAHTAGLRSMKGSVYEGGIRSPFFARWPARLGAGVTGDLPAAHIDVMPTILNACGVPAPAGVKFDGQSLLLLLTQGPLTWKDRPLFFQWHRGDVPVLYHNFAVVRDPWKLLNASNAGSQTLPGEPKFELYSLASDPGETRDLAAEHPEKVRDLKHQYERWFKKVGSTRSDNYAPPRIVIGHADTGPVILTPQDRRAGHQGKGWDIRGPWLVHVAEPRVYNVRLLLKEPAAEAVQAELKVNAVELHAEVMRGASEYLFEVPLESGDAALQAATIRMKDGERVAGDVYHVHVSW